MLRNARDIKSKLSLLLQASSLIFNLKKKKKKKSQVSIKRKLTQVKDAILISCTIQQKIFQK